MKLLQKILHYVLILKVGLPSLNAFLSGPKSPNDKVSVSSDRELHVDSKSHLTFDFWASFVGVIAVWNMGAFLGHPVGVEDHPWEDPKLGDD